jgi:hypothetical protein
MSDAPEDRLQQTSPVDPVFPRFFRNGEEPQHKLVGLIAYGLYEEARREWVDDFKGREKRFPNLEELRAYESSWTASRLDGLKNAAVQILASYADTLAREVENQALRGALRGGFVKGVVRWLFSAFIFSAAVLAFIVVLSRAGLDPVAAFQSLLRSPSSTPSPPGAARPVTPIPSSPAPDAIAPVAPVPSSPAPPAIPPVAPIPSSPSSPPVTPPPRSGR